MNMFIFQHIDSIIQVAAGIVATWIGFRHRNDPRKIMTLLKFCGPALIVIGVILLFRPVSTATWERAFTADNAVSAEFPGKPTMKESNDTLGGVTVRRTSLSYNVPGKEINLLLSSSLLPADRRGMTDDQKVDATLAYFLSQGNSLVQKEKIKTAVATLYRFCLRQEDKKATIRIALVYSGGSVYRAVAAWIDADADASLTDRFIDSFRIADTGGNRTPPAR